jgi:hypothetical protein
MYEYIEIWHNRRRGHSALGWPSPIEFGTRNKIVVAKGFHDPTPPDPGHPRASTEPRGGSQACTLS